MEEKKIDRSATISPEDVAKWRAERMAMMESKEEAELRQRQEWAAKKAAERELERKAQEEATKDYHRRLEDQRAARVAELGVLPLPMMKTTTPEELQALKEVHPLFGDVDPARMPQINAARWILVDVSSDRHNVPSSYVTNSDFRTVQEIFDGIHTLVGSYFDPPLEVNDVMVALLLDKTASKNDATSPADFYKRMTFGSWLPTLKDAYGVEDFLDGKCRRDEIGMYPPMNGYKNAELSTFSAIRYRARLHVVYAAIDQLRKGSS